MTPNRRFCLNEDRYVIDMLNAANTGKVCRYDGDPEDESRLRESILYQLLDDLLERLIINLSSVKTLPSGEEYQPYNEQRFAVAQVVFRAIKASHLNSFDPAISVQHKFGGTLNRQKLYTQDFTSLALFRDDVERLLRDLYGDIESEAMNSVLAAVFGIVKGSTEFTRTDLFKEDEDAKLLDYILGDLIEKWGISGSEFRGGLQARSDLILRVCEVRANPSTVSEYTVEFAEQFSQHWICSPEIDAEIRAVYPEHRRPTYHRDGNLRIEAAEALIDNTLQQRSVHNQR